MSLVLNNVSREINGRPLFRDLSFSVQPGEMVAVVGPSGCGKSSMLRCVNGLDKLDGGEVAMDNKSQDSFHPSDWRKDVLYCAQGHYASGPADTPLNHAEFVGKLSHVNDSTLSEKSCTIASRLGIDRDKFSSPWKTLSGGESARCRISIFLAQCPRFLLLDEPTAALDTASTSLVEAEVRRTKAGVIWVTHDPSQAQRFDKTVKMTRASG
eukprot:TRINITY_DN3419_c3_g1_i1.p1 TRINITY_DN3419_c3_g1~~TRINITY_DN3419_c3_g1_i1.p1  ORF type:complete len:211 (+),score=25.57 TRINITY_DN3419_c3_g1_i1:82-714(+)